MIHNLPPELVDLEIHVQDLLAEMKDLKSELSAAKKDIATIESELNSMYPLGRKNTVAHFVSDVTQPLNDNTTVQLSMERELFESPYISYKSGTTNTWVANASGFFIIRPSMLYNTLTDDYQHWEIRVNINGSGREYSRTILDTANNHAEYSSIETTWAGKLNKGDEITITAYQNNSANLNGQMNHTDVFTNVKFIYLVGGE